MKPSRRMGFLGTSATRLMRFCPCPIWSYRPQRSAGEEQVVAAVEASPVDERHAGLNRQILEVALSLTTGKPHIAHAWSVYGEHLIKDYMKPADFEALVKESEQQARAKLEDMLRSFNLSVDAPEVHLLRGSGEEELAKFVNVQNYDVLVIGTVGRSGISGLLVGNTAELLLDRVECSILAVRPTEFVSPIGA